MAALCSDSPLLFSCQRCYSLCQRHSPALVCAESNAGFCRLPFMRGPLCFTVTAVSEVKVSHRNLSAEAVRRTSWFTPLMSRWQTTLCASDLRLCASPSLHSPPGRLSALLLWEKQKGKQLDKFNNMPIKMLSLWDSDQLIRVLQWQLVITREQVGWHANNIVLLFFFDEIQQSNNNNKWYQICVCFVK